MITVTVPATSANVGAGFDSLGLAVSMYNTFTFEEADRIQNAIAYRHSVP